MMYLPSSRTRSVISNNNIINIIIMCRRCRREQTVVGCHYDDDDADSRRLYCGGQVDTIAPVSCTRL